MAIGRTATITLKQLKWTTNKTAVTAQQLIYACQRQFAKCQTLNKNYRNKHNVLATDLWHNNHNHSISCAYGVLLWERDSEHILTMLRPIAFSLSILYGAEHLFEWFGVFHNILKINSTLKPTESIANDSFHMEHRQPKQWCQKCQKECQWYNVCAMDVGCIVFGRQ